MPVRAGLLENRGSDTAEAYGKSNRWRKFPPLARPKPDHDNDECAPIAPEGTD